MGYILRQMQQKIEKTLKRGKSILLLGPRQTGKTTLLHKLALDRYISLANLETGERAPNSVRNYQMNRWAVSLKSM